MKVVSWMRTIVGVILVFIFPLVIGTIKLFSTSICLIIHPIESISVITGNWYRVVFCTDIGAIPELIPSIEQVSERSPIAAFRASNLLRIFGQLFTNPKKFDPVFFEEFGGNRNIFMKIIKITLAFYVGIFFFFLSAILFLIPGLAYRYAVKSTALIWSPLLWVSRPVSNPTDIKLTMSRILTRSIYKASRIYSTMFTIAFIAKMYLWLHSGELPNTFVSPSVLKAAREFIVPDQLPVWHLTSAFNSIASWGLYFISDYYFRDWQDGVQIPENSLRYVFL
jgi:hypothetical protein